MSCVEAPETGLPAANSSDLDLITSVILYLIERTKIVLTITNDFDYPKTK
jgi:hypothetical protein